MEPEIRYTVPAAIRRSDTDMSKNGRSSAPSQISILLAEDSRTQALELTGILTGAGYLVQHVPDGLQALACVRKSSPDLIISDVMMPGMDGYTLCRTLKQHPDTASIPVILATTLEAEEHLIQGLESGADFYLTKPVSAETLLKRVRQAARIAPPPDEAPAPALSWQGRSLHVHPGRLLNLLLSTYESAQAHKRELKTAKNNLLLLNTQLESRVREKTAHLEKEILEHKQTSAALRESEQLLRRQAGELEESNLLKELLLDILSHDLKNPAGVIHSLAEMLSAAAPGDERLQLVARSSTSLLKVVETTGDLAQCLNGEQIPKEALDLGVLVHQLVKEFEEQFEAQGMTLENHLPDRLPVQANFLILQILRNYLSNAVKYATGGKAVHIDWQVTRQTLTVMVRDFGTTIPEGERERIFERRYQLQNGRGCGRGLGLAIVKKIAEAHQGSVEVIPNPPRGNIFCLHLPRSKDEVNRTRPDET